MAAQVPNRIGEVAASTSRTVITTVRYVSVELSILLWRLLMTTAWILWKLMLNAGRQAFLLAGGALRRPPVEEGADGHDEDAAPLEAPTDGEAHSEDLVTRAGESAHAATAPTGAVQDSTIEQSPSPIPGNVTRGLDDQDLVLRCLQLPAPKKTKNDSARRNLKRAVAQVRAGGHRKVRFSVQAESERPASVSVLGPASTVREACEALAEHVDFDSSKERETERLFLVHFTMRESWDLPQDDELVEASIANDWIDLGNEGQATTDASSTEMQDDSEEEGTGATRSPQAVLRKRLQEVVLDRDGIHVFMDDNPFATSQNNAVRVDFAGTLPSAWDAAARMVLACEARGVFLSRRFEVLFWPPDHLREPLEGQVESALSHCQGAPKRISRGPSGFGLVGCDMSSFEDLSDNVSAVLGGHTPPGWHRMEWTPDGADAMPHRTY